MTHDHVTFATAILLKDAGFPQPAPAPGQFWYNKYEDIICWGHTVDSWGEPYEDATTFAPTATDILRELHNHFATMPGHSVNIELSPIDDGFQVDVFEDLPFGAMEPVCEIHERPAEAAALAWINLHEKK